MKIHRVSTYRMQGYSCMRFFICGRKEWDELKLKGKEEGKNDKREADR